MCDCANKLCHTSRCHPNCSCQKQSPYCCFTLGCKPYTRKNPFSTTRLVFGHKEECYCLELKCCEKHHSLCTCDETCHCESYQCPKTCCSTRKANESCLFFKTQLCDHCDQLRIKSMRKTKCNCKCDCRHYCGHCVFQCETHRRRGWNLEDWQQLRNVKIVTETPKLPPYFYQDVDGKQVTTCTLCKKESKILDAYDHDCNVCQTYVCRNVHCLNEHMNATEDVDYDYNCIPFYRTTPYSCILPSQHKTLD